ncbi:MAG: ATP-binding protein [Saprospiraceae bacterium]|nr:MAG: ATP-binding protein [Saprospiraceae bacterium]
MILKRHLNDRAASMLTKYPMIAVTGPRQSGKTTFCRQLCPGYQYLNMELAENQQHARQDPHHFFQLYKGGVILDEVQNVPELFPYLQYYTDLRNEPGEYILSGSQHFLLLEKITQSLAGRISIFNLLPFSLEELKGSPWEKNTWEEYLRTGFYPRIYEREISPTDFYPDYLQTYVERDVRQLLNVSNLALFRNFITACAGRTGQLLNLAQLGSDVGIDVKTVKSWFSILEASFITYRLQPWFRNFNKRIVKTPKLYFYDTGLAAYLLGVRSATDLESHFARGALFENFVINELLKNQFNAGERPQVFFWQDSNANEIDLLFDRVTSQSIVEIKAGKTVHPDFFKNLKLFKNLNPAASGSWVVYGGDQMQPRSDATVLTWKDLASLT